MIRWGILGTAGIAEKQVVPAIDRSGNGLPHAVSSGSGRQQEFADRLGIPRAYASHDDLLADEEVDAVYIPLPNNLHAEWTIRAARAGKHVLCEKPIALSPAEFDRIDAVRSGGIHVAEAFMYRHHPQITVLREQLGRIGELVAIEARFHFLLDPAAGPNIRLDDALGGGALRDIGCYPIDLMNLLVGAPPDEVLAVAATLDDAGVETALGAVLRYGTVIGSWGCSFRSPAYDGCLVIGSGGTVELRTPFRPDRTGSPALVVVNGTDEIEVPGDLYRLEVEDFARRIIEDDPDDAGWQLSRWTAGTTDRIAASAGLTRL